MISRINLLIKEIVRNPSTGIGKAEPLRHALQGYWSRRITSEHRIVYKKTGDQILIAQVRYHYR
jgi:toxin YoeB